LVLDSANESSSLAAYVSTVVELLEGWIDAATANNVCWWSRSAFVATVSHFPMLKSELELLGSGHNEGLTEDEANAL
jgi:hypothetical protein